MSDDIKPSVSSNNPAVHSIIQLFATLSDEEKESVLYELALGGAKESKPVVSLESLLGEHIKRSEKD